MPDPDWPQTLLPDYVKDNGLMAEHPASKLLLRNVVIHRPQQAKPRAEVFFRAIRTEDNDHNRDPQDPTGTHSFSPIGTANLIAGKFSKPESPTFDTTLELSYRDVQRRHCGNQASAARQDWLQGSTKKYP